MIPLRYQQSTQFFVMGPFISTDGDTESTGLTINSTDVWIFKDGSTSASNKSTTGLTAMDRAHYGGYWSSDDTATYGVFEAYVHVSSALYVKEYFEVLPDNEYYARKSTAYKDVDVASISSGAISSQTISSGAISTITLSTAAWDVGAHANWAESTKTLTAFSTALWSTAFHSTAEWSTAFWSTAFYSTTVSDNVSTAVWSYGTRALTDYSSCVLSTAGRDAVVDAIWDEARADHVSTTSMGYTQSTAYTVSASVSTSDYDSISDNVWGNSTRTLTAFSTSLFSTAISDNISTAVWNYATRTLSAFSTSLFSTAISDNISTAVWNYGTRALTDKANFTLAAGAISSAIISSGALYSSAHILSSLAFSSGWISTVSFSSGAISTLALSTAAWDQSALSVWSASTKTLTAFSTALWSTAFFSTAFWSTSFYSTAVSDNVSTAIWNYGTKTLSSAAYDSIFDVLVDSTMTVKHYMMLTAAVRMGNSTGGGTSTAVFYGIGSTVARVTATTSSLGNRSGLTYDVS